MSTWNALSLQYNTHPRVSRYFRKDGGSKDLNDKCSFTFLRPPHTSRAAVRPSGVKPAKCKMVMFLRQLMLARDNSPTSVTEQYDKFICNQKRKIFSSTVYTKLIFRAIENKGSCLLQIVRELSKWKHPIIIYIDTFLYI